MRVCCYHGSSCSDTYYEWMSEKCLPSPGLLPLKRKCLAVNIVCLPALPRPTGRCFREHSKSELIPRSAAPFPQAAQAYTAGSLPEWELCYCWLVCVPIASEVYTLKAWSSQHGCVHFLASVNSESSGSDIHRRSGTWIHNQCMC